MVRSLRSGRERRRSTSERRSDELSRFGSRDIIKSNEVNPRMVEGVVTLAEEFGVESAAVEPMASCSPGTHLIGGTLIRLQIS